MSAVMTSREIPFARTNHWFWRDVWGPVYIRAGVYSLVVGAAGSLLVAVDLEASSFAVEVFGRSVLMVEDSIALSPVVGRTEPSLAVVVESKESIFAAPRTEGSLFVVEVERSLLADGNTGSLTVVLSRKNGTLCLKAPVREVAKSCTREQIEDLESHFTVQDHIFISCSQLYALNMHGVVIQHVKHWTNQFAVLTCTPFALLPCAEVAWVFTGSVPV